MLSGGLRAGHSFPQSIDALVHEAPSPTREEFQRVLFETQLGHPLPQAMRNLAERVGSEDFEWVTEAVEIQRDIGGDLADLLDNVTDTIRDRRRVSRQITTLTAEGRLSAVILFCLPIAMFGVMTFANRAYFHTLTSSTAGKLMLVGSGALMVVGGLWLRRIVRPLY
jgi:tight adherence protein B